MDDSVTAFSARGEATPTPPEPDAVWAHPAMRLLARVVRRVRQVDLRRPWLWDTTVVVLAAAAAPPDLLATTAGRTVSDRLVGGVWPTGAVLVVAAVLVVPLWWRRRAPTTVLAVSGPFCLVLWSLGLGPAAATVLLVALFNLALHSSPRAIRWALPVTAAGWVLVVVFVYPVTGPVAFLVMTIGTGVASLALGLFFRIRRLYVEALQDRAARLEIERDQRTLLTAAAERSRIAREMHDILGHNLSIMVNLADGAAALTAHEPARVLYALGLIGDTGRQAMDELRRVLGVLRESPETPQERSPQPGIADLEALLGRVRAAGLPVTYRTDGSSDQLDRGVQLTVFRVIQEALTNTLKHVGPGASAEVTLAVTNSDVHVRVTDNGPPTTEARPGSREHDGHGLFGIRQRASLYGGTASIGPRADANGWIVDVQLVNPIPAAPGASTP